MHHIVCPKIANKKKYAPSYIRASFSKPPKSAPQLGHHGHRGKDAGVGEQRSGSRKIGYRNAGRKPVSPKPHVKPHFYGIVFSSRTRPWVYRSRVKRGGGTVLHGSHSTTCRASILTAEDDKRIKTKKSCTQSEDWEMEGEPKARTGRDHKTTTLNMRCCRLCMWQTARCAKTRRFIGRDALPLDCEVGGHRAAVRRPCIVPDGL